MNITFLIGNGFDINLGLKTKYSDFVKYYKSLKAKSDTLKKFHDYITENEELWSAAEIAMGEYTSEFEKGSAAAFSECHIDFCEQLALYLKEQMSLVDYDNSKEFILKAFSNLNEIVQAFPAREREILDNVYERRKAEQRVFNFICFNYTDTLDQCVLLAKAVPNTLGSHKYLGENMQHLIGKICHVHGTVEKEMVFGVNDDSQIANVGIFDCDYGDLYEHMLIKIQANASYKENADENAAQLIYDSNLIYIYGMSIGDTDKLWWNRICTWLSDGGDRHLIIYKHDMPQKTVIPLVYQKAEKEAIRNFISHSSLDDSKKKSIEARIHITGENIFKDIQYIADDLSYNDEENINLYDYLKPDEKVFAQSKI